MGKITISQLGSAPPAPGAGKSSLWVGTDGRVRSIGPTGIPQSVADPVPVVSANLTEGSGVGGSFPIQVPYASGDTSTYNILLFGEGALVSARYSTTDVYVFQTDDSTSSVIVCTNAPLSRSDIAECTLNTSGEYVTGVLIRASGIISDGFVGSFGSADTFQFQKEGLDAPVPFLASDGSFEVYTILREQDYSSDIAAAGNIYTVGPITYRVVGVWAESDEETGGSTP